LGEAKGVRKRRQQVVCAEGRADRRAKRRGTKRHGAKEEGSGCGNG
jgi:hypothetical protein